MTDIVIRHTHEDGTVLEGSSKGDGVLEIVRRHGGFTWRPVPGIFIRGSRNRDAKTWKINAAAEALRAAGHQVTVAIDNTWRPAEVVDAERAERAEDRADRLAERAGNVAVKAAASREAAQNATAGIPFGQPKLVGHHSERPHQRALDRHDAGMRRSFEQADYAGELARRADAALGNEAARQNPRAIARRIKTLEEEGRRIDRKLNGYSRNFYNGRGELHDVERHDAATGEWAEDLTRRGEAIADEVAYLRRKLAKLEASGEFVAWGPEHFRKGDQVNVSGRWCTVRRVNKKSVSVPWIVGTMTTGVESEHTDTVPWDKVYGRRRDRQQLDRPNGVEWPVELADKVARWAELRRELGRPLSYDDEQLKRRHNIEHAVRLALGLPITASDPEVNAHPEPEGVDERREFYARCVDVFDRLQGGEHPNQVAADLDPVNVEPAWRFPDGDPEDVRADEIQEGDLVKGIWDNAFGGRRLITSFAGPVASVDHKPAYLELSARTTITLTDGDQRELRFPAWLAAYRAGAAAGDQDSGRGGEPAQPEPVEPQQLTLLDTPTA